jgi:UDP-N-acetyl-D-galactosamine dehydrogenase
MQGAERMCGCARLVSGETSEDNAGRPPATITPMNATRSTPPRVAIIGLGYVGLPLAVAFGKLRPTVGYDINQRRVEALRSGRDETREVSPDELKAAAQLAFTTELADIADCGIYIVTVPTPVDEAQRPDLAPLISASEAVGKVLKAGDIVIYESTVYPGTTEEVCVPILERESGLRYEAGPAGTEEAATRAPDASSAQSRGRGNRESAPTFAIGYSPERINPGDTLHRLATITKVTSGSSPETAETVDALYRSIVTAGTHKAPSIKVAEAAKVIENIQRDVNIALMNELAMIFDKMGIDTHEVLAAAGTKWNFLPFRPGLVGGHCIGVDPYYLTHKATVLGYHPELTLAARRINDKVAIFVANQVQRLMARRRIHVVGSRILVLGTAYKENCADLRNTKVVDLVRELQAANARVEVHDPWVDPDLARQEYALELVAEPRVGSYDAIILAVAHRQFLDLGANGIRAYGKPESLLYDVKGVLPREAVDGRL